MHLKNVSISFTKNEYYQQYQGWIHRHVDTHVTATDKQSLANAYVYLALKVMKWYAPVEIVMLAVDSGEVPHLSVAETITV